MLLLGILPHAAWESHHLYWEIKELFSFLRAEETSGGQRLQREGNTVVAVNTSSVESYIERSTNSSE